MRATGPVTPNRDKPGVVGIARIDRRADDLARRVGPGDVVVLDRIDLDRVTADALVEAQVAAVVNASPSISGRFPNLGPEALLDAGIPLVDGVGAQALRDIKDGCTLRLHEDTLYLGDRAVATGTRQTRETVADQIADARAGMTAQLEAFSGNIAEFLSREHGLVLDGMGVPAVRTPMAGRQVLVVAPGHGHASELRQITRYVAEHRPVVIAVESAADTLHAAGITVDIIVGDSSALSGQALGSGAEVVVRAEGDGHAPGLERIQDLGAPVVPFPTSSNVEDIALLLADAHGASLILTVGFEAGLREFLDKGRSGANPSTILTRLKVGPKLVDANAVAIMRTHRISLAAVALLALAALLVISTALAVSEVGPASVKLVADAWRGVFTWIGGVLS